MHTALSFGEEFGALQEPPSGSLPAGPHPPLPTQGCCGANLCSDASDIAFALTDFFDAQHTDVFSEMYPHRVYSDAKMQIKEEFVLFFFSNDDYIALNADKVTGMTGIVSFLLKAF